MGDSHLMLLFLMVLVLGGTVAMCDGNRARAHDLYSDWKMPDSPATSCCNEHDCRPVTAYLDEDGRWVANVGGVPVKIPPHKVMKGPSPDGRSHWCGNAASTYCFKPGETRS